MMKKTAQIVGVTLGLVLSGLAGPAVGAQANGMMQLASQTCLAKGQQVAASRNATLVGAQEVNRGGRAVCEVVILVQGQGGDRPRREVVFVDR